MYEVLGTQENYFLKNENASKLRKIRINLFLKQMNIENYMLAGKLMGLR